MSNKVSGLLLLPNGTRKTVHCEPGSFDDLRQHVDFEWFDVVRTDHPVTIFVDDEGLLKENNPVNIWSIVLLPEFGISQPLVGPVFMFGDTDPNGEIRDLSDEVLSQIPTTLRPQAGFEVRMVDID